MENNIQLYQFDKSLSTEQNIKNFILKKIEMTRILKRMNKIEDIYGDEVSEQENKLHITKQGNAMFVSDMEDSHLINTVKILLKKGANHSSGRVRKYMEEIKKRNLVHEVINIDTDSDSDEPWTGDDRYEDSF